jgi:hypothetical protein
MAMEFAGGGLPMSTDGLGKGCDRLGVKAADVWAVLTVETKGCGFLPDRRPQILFERHIFHRETNGAHDQEAPEVSNATPGGYGPIGAHQYDRLAQAIQLDREAALRSASWGIGQVMGFNSTAAGYSNVEAMVASMVASEDEQLGAMLGWLASNRMDSTLRAHDWTNFARAYNGANYAINQYDVKLAAAYQQFATGLLPDLTVRAAQIYLTYLGYHPGSVDGRMGRMTSSAVVQFQQDQGLAQSGTLDDVTLGSLQTLAASTTDSPRILSAGG